MVIPTYNRWECLNATLEALCKQDRLPDEVIIIDDGSTDDTWANLQEWESASAHPFRLALYTQENAGPAKARNLGVRQSRSDLIAFLGDDTIPGHDWLQKHLDMQNSLGPDAVVVGYTDWDHATMRVTPFLRYINGRGAQFKYDLMSDGDEVPFSCFYTSNLSVPRELLLAEPFDESFGVYGWEDAEVGYRLIARGVRIVYCKSACTRHRHPTTVATFMRRQFVVGRSCPTLLKLHPELSALYYYKKSALMMSFVGVGYFGRLFLPVVRLLDYCYIPQPRIVYLFFLGWYYVRGLRSAESDTSV